MTKLDSLDLSQINADLHWAFGYLGTPWVSGGDGALGYDCYTFTRHIQAAHFGITMPAVDVDAYNFKAVANAMRGRESHAQWQRVDTPTEGACVLMAHAKYPSHIGVYLDVDGGGVLHCVRGEGVVFSTLSALQLSGWSRLEFYTHASHA